MDSSNAEKAWREYRAGHFAKYGEGLIAGRPAFMTGRASRDAEVAELRQAQQEQWYQNDVALAAENTAALRALAESRARFGDSEARRAELEAVIAALRETWLTTAAQRLVDESPSVVLEDRDRENRAIGWDEGHNHCFHVENPKNEGNPYRGANR